MKIIKYISYNVICFLCFVTLMSCEQNYSNYPKFYQFDHISIKNAVQYTIDDEKELNESEVKNIESEPIIDLFPIEISLMSEQDLILAYNINDITKYLDGELHFISDKNFLLTVQYPIYGNDTRKLVYSGVIKNNNLILSGYFYSVTNLLNNDFATESGIGYLNEETINSMVSSDKLIFSVNFNIEYQISN